MRLLGPVADKASRDLFIFFIALLLVQSELPFADFLLADDLTKISDWQQQRK